MKLPLSANGGPAGRRLAGLVLMLAALLAVPGCNVLGWAAHGLVGEETVKVTAQYTKLANKSVAVVVAADEHTLYLAPGAPMALSHAISTHLASAVPGVKPASPKDIIEFQTNNPYWHTLTYGDLMKRFKVDRLVYVDVSEYSTHEPGNSQVWQGTIRANVFVAEAEGANPDDAAYKTNVAAQYPEGARVGLLESDDDTIQLGMLKVFSRRVGWLFQDHEEKVQQE